MITLYKNYKYDNNYDYIKTFGSVSEQESYFNSLSKIVIDTDDYVKDFESIRVGLEYDYLLMEGINYLSFNNGDKTIYAFITRKIYENEEVTTLNYEIDVIQTFLFDFNINKSFVVRKKCELDEILDFDEGLEMGVHRIESDITCINKTYEFFAFFSAFKNYFINSDDGKDYKEYNLYGDNRYPTKLDGIEYPLMFYKIDDSSIDEFGKYLYNLPNLQGIIRMPSCTSLNNYLPIPLIKVENNKFKLDILSTTHAVESISPKNEESGAISVAKNNITDFFPYTYYVLTDGEAEPLIMKPQLLPSSFTVKSKIALSTTPIERYYPSSYAGSTDGTIYNITNSNVMLLPVATNGGLETISSSMNQLNQSYSNAKTGLVLSGVQAVSSAVSSPKNPFGVVEGVKGVISGYQQVKSEIARNRDLQLVADTIKSMGTPSTRKQFNTDRVRVVKYTIDDKYKERINNFIERYGNKYNNYATIDIKSYKGYIQFANVDIDSSIDNSFINIISNILERGVYIE